MSLSIRRRKEGDENQNYLASVSDLMSGLLYVFILILVIAIFKLQSATVKAGAGFVEYAEQMVDVGITSTRLMIELDRAIQVKAGIKVETQPENGVLRIPESAVTFETGSEELDAQNRVKLNRIGTEIARVLTCFIPEGVESSSCRGINPNRHTLESVFIEGHTDNQTFQGDTTEKENRLLSTRRANAAYLVMVHSNPALKNAKNSKGMALFSLAGYGPDRPAEGHAHKTPTSDAANRRIELRFTMTQPVPSEKMLTLLKEGKNVR